MPLGLERAGIISPVSAGVPPAVAPAVTLIGTMPVISGATSLVSLSGSFVIPAATECIFALVMAGWNSTGGLGTQLASVVLDPGGGNQSTFIIDRNFTTAPATTFDPTMAGAHLVAPPTGTFTITATFAAVEARRAALAIVRITNWGSIGANPVPLCGTVFGADLGINILSTAAASTLIGMSAIVRTSGANTLATLLTTTTALDVSSQTGGGSTDVVFRPWAMDAPTIATRRPGAANPGTSAEWAVWGVELKAA